ncbi:APC family permease [Ochrobactrum sp. BD67]
MNREINGDNPLQDAPYTPEEIGSGIGNTGNRPALRRVLGMPALIAFGLAYMVPLAVFDTYGIVTTVTEGHLPTAYALTLMTMFFTAYSYGRMVEAYPVAGSAYSYARKAFGGHIGFMVGWALLLDYIFLPMLNFILIGIYMSQYFPAISPHLWVIGAILLVTSLNILGIKIVSGMNFLIIAFQLIFLTVFLTLFLTSFGRYGTTSILAPFYSSDMKLGTIVAGSAILCLSFLGFDAVSTLSEEAREPRRTIPRAIMLCTLIGGLLFIIASWTGHMIYPDWRSFPDPDSASRDVMSKAGGAFLVSFFTAAYMSGTFASAMAAQASVSRILYAMGRDRVLPQNVFGAVSRKFGTPVCAILVVATTSLLALTIELEQAASMISFGALAGFSFVNLAVIKTGFLDGNRRQGWDAIRYGVLPGIGFLLTLWLWANLSANTFDVGLIWLGTGFLYLLYLTRVFKRSVPQLRLHDL